MKTSLSTSLVPPPGSVPGLFSRPQALHQRGLLVRGACSTSKLPTWADSGLTHSWNNYCAVSNTTNGINYETQSTPSRGAESDDQEATAVTPTDNTDEESASSLLGSSFTVKFDENVRGRGPEYIKAETKFDASTVKKSGAMAGTSPLGAELYGRE